MVGVGVEVVFKYDEKSGKWEVFVGGVEDATEAVQAFNAVVLTVRQARVGDFHKAVETANEYEYEIHPVVE